MARYREACDKCGKRTHRDEKLPTGRLLHRNKRERVCLWCYEAGNERECGRAGVARAA